MRLNYYKKREIENATYSIDFFTFEFALSLTPALWEELESAVRESGKKAKRFSSYSGTKKKGRYHKYRSYQIGELHVQFYDDAPVVQLNFNPNTIHTCDDNTPLGVLSFVLGYIRSSASIRDICVRRVDYALDLPIEYKCLYVYTRKCESHFRSTRYYGDAKSSGRLRVYDKAAEQREKYKIDIGVLTRCEWVQRNEKSFNYDTIGTFDFSGLSGGISVISLVPVEFFNEGLQRFSVNTRRKIISGMKKISLCKEAFDELLREYYHDYGIAELRFISLQNRLSDIDFDFSFGADEEDLKDDSNEEN